jgi:hypothetical protein
MASAVVYQPQRLGSIPRASAEESSPCCGGFVVAPVKPVQATAAKTGGVLVARPAEIDFHQKFAGTRTYKRTKITNTGQTAVLLWVADTVPDYFGYGGNPGQTCSFLRRVSIPARGQLLCGRKVHARPWLARLPRWLPDRQGLRADE